MKNHKIYHVLSILGLITILSGCAVQAHQVDTIGYSTSVITDNGVITYSNGYPNLYISQQPFYHMAPPYIQPNRPYNPQWNDRPYNQNYGKPLHPPKTNKPNHSLNRPIINKNTH